MDTKLLKQKILDLAIRGKLVPQEPNDEPASVLLERIRAEKEQLVQQGKIKKPKTTAASDTQHYENIPKGWATCQLEDIIEYEQPSQYIVESTNYKNEYKTPVLTAGKSFILGYTNEIDGIYDKLPTIIFDDFTTDSRLVDFPFKVKSSAMKILQVNKEINIDYVAYFMSITRLVGDTHKRYWISEYSKISIPLPPFNEQKRIVEEIKKWFSLIDDLEQNQQELHSIIQKVKSKVLDLAIHGKLVPQDPNDEPAIELLKRINPHYTPCDTSHYENLPQGWEILHVGDVADYINGRAFKPEEWEEQGLPIIRIQNLNDENAAYNYSTAEFEDKYLIHKGDLLFAWAASLGTYIWQNDDAWLNQHIFKVIPKSFIQKEFLYYSFVVMIRDFYSQTHGSGMVHITKGKFEMRPILIPPIAEQKRIVTKIEEIINTIDTISAEL